jgi:hypothetical protein
VDDLLADPGIQLGEHPVTSCEEGLALLERRTATGEAADDPIYDLAALLLAAELNLNAGAESCPIVEEAVVGPHLILASAGFDGVSASPLDAESGAALLRVIELLEAHSRGELCV